MLTAMIEVTKRQGTEQVRATLSKSGLLGVHRKLSCDDSRSEEWTISHTLTGYRILSFRRKRDALRIMRYINGWDWDFTPIEAAPEETQRRGRDLLSILRNDALLEGGAE